MEGETPELSSETPQSTGKKRRRGRKKKKAKETEESEPIEEEEEEEEEPSTPLRNLTADLEASASPSSGGRSRSKSQSSVSRNPAPSQGRMPSNTVKLGGVDIAVNTTAPSADTGVLIRSKKEDRKKLDADQREALFQAITKQQHTVFEEQPLTIASIKDLEDTYNLHNSLKKVEIHFIRRDVIDVFSIVFPKRGNNQEILQALELDASGEAKTLNLFERYNEVTFKDVAASCVWYATWPKETDFPWFKENLELSYEYFQNHMSSSLWGRVMEDMQPYSSTTAGGAGPMLFILMINRLQVQSHVVIDTITTHLPTHLSNLQRSALQ